MRLHPMELKHPMLTRYLSPIFGIVLLTIIGSASVAADRPNIVIILADDLGYGSLNSYGADEAHIRTPNIDRLASEGRRFTDANTPSSVCSPTRYGLLTGRYDWRTDQKHGVLNTNDPLHIETSRSTIASLLKSAGYRTAAIGKWHLGYGTERHDFTKPLSPGPLDLGFDYHFAVPQNHGDASGVYVRNRAVVGLRSDRRISVGKSPYGPDYMGIDAPQRVDQTVMDELTTDAVEWLGQQRQKTPFFLYFAPVAIHFPYTPSEKTKGTSGIGLYGDWIHELDLSVGRILDTLDRMRRRTTRLLSSPAITAACWSPRASGRKRKRIERVCDAMASGVAASTVFMKAASVFPSSPAGRATSQPGRCAMKQSASSTCTPRSPRSSARRFRLMKKPPRTVSVPCRPCWERPRQHRFAPR
jgi:arylsulfatase A-like enzyme